MSRQHTANFDEHPPVPVGDYDAMARGVNVGYELIFELATALLRAHCPSDAHLLLVGAGGSTEVQAFGAADPRWRLTIVDPSADMLSLARARVDACDLADRVQLVRGTLDDLPADARFDAATAIFVMMHLPDDGSKLYLLRTIAERLKPGAPLLLVDGVLDHLDRFAPAWQHYAVARGTPSERMSAFLEGLAAGSTATTEARELALLDEAGFRDATRFFTAFLISGWIARR
ncbi:MAG: class I SAM-dependent methyltransferase [Chloroflexota bacterium]|nr:class I SAM-dependent methyltransferase [Chloroflexota bacterium]